MDADKWCFLGVAILQRSIRLYAPFYSSDILIASPLGLRTIIGGEGEKKRDFDFLSSIELLIIDQADIYLMQNWEHVLVMMSLPRWRDGILTRCVSGGFSLKQLLAAVSDPSWLVLRAVLCLKGL